MPTMRTIKIPLQAILEWSEKPVGEEGLALHVKVDWEELRLTDQQMIENSIAMVNGQDDADSMADLFKRYLFGGATAHEWIEDYSGNRDICRQFYFYADDKPSPCDLCGMVWPFKCQCPVSDQLAN